MSDRAIESGIYMRSLSRRETIASMAATVVDHLIGQGHYQEAIAVSEIILKHNPRDAYVLLKKGTAFGHLLRVEFYDKYPLPILIPEHLRSRYLLLCEQNFRAFAAAEALGWGPSE